jgi:hypothetical protein
VIPDGEPLFRSGQSERANDDVKAATAEEALYS